MSRPCERLFPGFHSIGSEYRVQRTDSNRDYCAAPFTVNWAAAATAVLSSFVKVAMIVALPFPVAVTKPDLETVATDASVEVQTTRSVISSEALLSCELPFTRNCITSPGAPTDRTPRTNWSLIFGWKLGVLMAGQLTALAPVNEAGVAEQTSAPPLTTPVNPLVVALTAVTP